MICSSQPSIPSDGLVNRSMRRRPQYPVFFLNPAHTEQFVERDPTSGSNILKVRLLEDIPSDFRRHINQALTLARSSFDQVLHAAYETTGYPTKRVMYPWADNLDKLNVYLKNAPDPFQKLIKILSFLDPIPPGNSGDNIIRKMASLSNRKHDVGIKLGASADIRDIEVRMPNAVVNFGFTQWDPIKKEIEVLRWINDTGPGLISFKLYFYAGLDTPGESGETPATNPVRSFIDKADIVYESFKLKCEEILSDEAISESLIESSAAHVLAATDWRSRIKIKPPERTVRPPTNLRKLSRATITTPKK